MGFWELLVMAVIGLLVLGPERLPRAARQLGRWLSAARRTAAQLRWQIEREIDLGDQQQRHPSRPAESSAGAATGDDRPAPERSLEVEGEAAGPLDGTAEGGAADSAESPRKPAP